MHKLDKKATNIPIEAPTFNQDVDLKRYSDRLEEHSYVDDLAACFVVPHYPAGMLGAQKRRPEIDR